MSTDTHTTANEDVVEQLTTRKGQMNIASILDQLKDESIPSKVHISPNTWMKIRETFVDEPRSSGKKALYGLQIESNKYMKDGDYIITDQKGQILVINGCVITKGEYPDFNLPPQKIDSRQVYDFTDFFSDKNFTRNS